MTSFIRSIGILLLVVSSITSYSVSAKCKQVCDADGWCRNDCSSESPSQPTAPPQMQVPTTESQTPVGPSPQTQITTPSSGVCQTPMFWCRISIPTWATRGSSCYCLDNFGRQHMGYLNGY